MQPIRLQFTMRRFMALVCVLAVFLAVIRYTTLRWGADAILAAAVTALLASTIAVQLPGFGRRVFWVSFAACGWVYLALSTIPPLEMRLPTERLLDDVRYRLPSSLTIPRYEFRRAGHAVLSMVFGLLGGCAAASLIPEKAKDGKTTQRPTFRSYFPSVVSFWSWLRQMGPRRRR